MFIMVLPYHPNQDSLDLWPAAATVNNPDSTVCTSYLDLRCTAGGGLPRSHQSMKEDRDCRARPAVVYMNKIVSKIVRASAQMTLPSTRTNHTHTHKRSLYILAVRRAIHVQCTTALTVFLCSSTAYRQLNCERNDAHATYNPIIHYQAVYVYVHEYVGCRGRKRS